MPAVDKVMEEKAMKRCMKCMREFKDVYDMCPYCGQEVGGPQKEIYFLPTGTILAGRYEIGMSVGSGGFGITYRAWDHNLEKEVAVKEYFPVGLVNRIPGEINMIVYSGNRAQEYTSGMQRFLEEARNMARFNTHPNIVNVYDFFEANHTVYIIMEYLDGVNYKEYIKLQGGQIPLEMALQITNSVLEALKEVHKAGILHRDISPDNVFLCRDGRIKLIDFGAARFSNIEEAKTRSIILKPGFAPPEQYQTKSKQGPWTDMYAVGAMLYRAVTGTVPEESVNRVEEDTLVPPIKLCAQLNQNQNNAILRAMSLLPELRFHDAESFQKALFGKGRVKDVGKEMRARKCRRVTTIGIASVFVLVGICLSLYFYNNKKREAAILDEASVTIWTYADGDETVEEKRETMESALREFREEYGQINLSIEVMDKADYEAALASAISQNQLPTLFESSGLTGEQLEGQADVKSVMDFVDVGNYYFLSSYKKYYPSGKQMPLSFSVSVNYVNTMLNSGGKTATELVAASDYVVSPDAVLNYLNEYCGTEINELSRWDTGQTDTYELPLSHLDSNTDLFIDKQMALLIADSSQYELIQENMAGIYEMQFMTGDNQIGYFHDVYSISGSSSAEEKAAAVQVLVYLLAENGQDVSYVQNGCYLPLNKNIFAAYTDINREFQGMEASFDELLFAGENQAVLERWYTGLEQAEQDVLR